MIAGLFLVSLASLALGGLVGGLVGIAQHRSRFRCEPRLLRDAIKDLPPPPPPPPEPPLPIETAASACAPYRDSRDSRIAATASRVDDLENELRRVRAELAALDGASR